MIGLTGFLTLTFVLLASLNGLKRKIKNKTFRKIASYHYVYGALSALSAILHGTLNVLDGNLRITGTIALLFVLIAATLGGSFKQLKKPTLYKWHRVIGPLSILAIIVHIILNDSI